MLNMIKKAFRTWKKHANHWKGEIIFLVALMKHPRLPRLPKILVFILLSYIFSPIDLIPDFIPIFGHWDDLFMIPITIKVVSKLTPEDVILEVRQKLAEKGDIPLFGGIAPKIVAVTVLILWIGLSWLFVELLGINEYIKIG